MKQHVLALALAASAFSGAASAATYTFGIPIAGNGPTAQFATLDATLSGNDDWTFTFSALNWGNFFGTGNAFIGGLALDAIAGSPGSLGGGVPLSVQSGGGVLEVEARNGGGPGGIYDLRIDFGQGARDRFTSGESVTFRWADSGITQLGSVALHLQGLEGNTRGYDGSIWYGPGGPLPAIPEPGTTALTLAGLAMLGFMARRRRQD